jgi:methylmalonyl-CoA mutase N-terminal domain/subunit
MVEAIERGYPQREIAESAYAFHWAVEARERIIVGVNDFVAGDEESIGILYIDESTGDRQLAKLEALRRRRDNDRVERALDALREGAMDTANTMPLLLEAVRAYATVGEMCDALRDVWGEYTEQAII